LSYIGSDMKTVSARQANHEFSELLSRVERGEEILITKRSKPVALLSPYRPALMTPERQKAIAHAISVMAKGLPWGTLRGFRRKEMHER
jgi:prevent-host-death family protein